MGTRAGSWLQLQVLQESYRMRSMPPIVQALHALRRGGSSRRKGKGNFVISGVHNVAFAPVGEDNKPRRCSAVPGAATCVCTVAFTYKIMQ
eukprot:750222-Prymnesium_polylepis.1